MTLLHHKLETSTSGVQPLRRDAKIMVQADKFRCMPNHPMKKRA